MFCSSSSCSSSPLSVRNGDDDDVVSQKINVKKQLVPTNTSSSDVSPENNGVISNSARARICFQGALLAAFLSTVYAFPDFQAPIVRYSKKIAEEQRTSNGGENQPDSNHAPVITNSVVKAGYNAGFIGLGFGILPGAIVDLLGVSLTCSCGAVLACVANIAFAISLQFQIPVLLVLSMFFYQNANKCMFLSTLIVAMNVVPDEYVGLLTGLFMMVDQFSGFVFKAGFWTFFGEENLIAFYYSFAGFILILALCNARTYWTCWEKQNRAAQNALLEENDGDESDNNAKILSKKKESKAGTIFCAAGSTTSDDEEEENVPLITVVATNSFDSADETHASRMVFGTRHNPSGSGNGSSSSKINAVIPSHKKVRSNSAQESFYHPYYPTTHPQNRVQPKRNLSNPHTFDRTNNLRRSITTPDRKRSPFTNNVYHGINGRRNSSFSKLSQADLETEIVKGSIFRFGSRGRSLRVDSRLSLARSRASSTYKYNNVKASASRKIKRGKKPEQNNSSDYTSDECSTSSEEEGHSNESAFSSASAQHFGEKKSLKSKRTLFGVFGLGLIMFLGKSQAMAFNYLKTTGLQSLGRAAKGRILTKSWLGKTNLLQNHASTRGVFFPDPEKIPTISFLTGEKNTRKGSEKSLPKLRFLKQQTENGHGVTTMKNSNSFFSNALPAMLKTADEFGVFVLLAGVKFTKNQKNNISKNDVQSGDDQHMVAQSLTVLVPEFSSTTNSGSDGTKKERENTLAGVTYSSHEFSVEKYGPDEGIFFLDELDLTKLNKLIAKNSEESGIISQLLTPDAEKNEKEKKKNEKEDGSNKTRPTKTTTTSNPPPSTSTEELSTQLSTVFLFLAGFGRFLGGVLSDVTVKYKVPKSAYFILAMLLMVVPFGFLAQFGWKQCSGQNNNSNHTIFSEQNAFLLTTDDSSALITITAIFALGYGMACSVSPIYVKEICPPHVIGRVYGTHMLSCVSGNSVFNSCFKLGDSILDEKFYPNAGSCIGPDCIKEFVHTGLYCMI